MIVRNLAPDAVAVLNEVYLGRVTAALSPAS